MTIFTAAFALLAAVVIGGFALLFSELRRLDAKFDAKFAASDQRFAELRRDLAEDLAAQRADADRRITALMAAVTAARRP